MNTAVSAMRVGCKQKTDSLVVIHTDSLENVHVKGGRMRQQWTCPKCKNSVTTHIKTNGAPICSNRRLHSDPQEMTTKGKKDADRK